MSEIIGAKVQVDAGEAIKNVGTLRQQLKASLTDLQNIQQEFGDVSPQALKAAQSVAGLRDAIKDANEVATLFDPEKKFQAVVGVAQGIASGFAAAQGAMALFGAESEQVQQALLKVQATMALAQGLQGLKAATEDFKRLGAVVANLSIVQKANNAINVLATGIMRALGIATETTGLAFNALKAAIITTGIGALVVAVGIAIQKISSLGDATSDAAKAQKDLNDELERTANTFTDEIVEIYEQDRQLQVARAKAAGATEAEIVEINRKANEQIATERAKNLAQQKVDGKDAVEAEKAYNKQVTDNQIFEYGVQQKAREDAEKAATKAADDRKAAQEKADAEAKKAAEEKAAAQKQLGELFKQNVAAQDQTEIELDAARRQRDADYVAYQTEIGAKQYEELQKQKNARVELDKAELDHKYAMANAIAGILQGLSSLAGEQTAAGKALAVTGAIISTYASANQAYWSAFLPVPTYLSPALGAVYAAAAVVSGLANVKRILSVNVPGKGGGGSAPGISAGGSAPITPQAPQVATTRIDQQSINDIGSAVPARAYVLESDITNSQARMNRIQTAARFE